MLTRGACTERRQSDDAGTYRDIVIRVTDGTETTSLAGILDRSHDGRDEPADQYGTDDLGCAGAHRSSRARAIGFCPPPTTSMARP